MFEGTTVTVKNKFSFEKLDKKKLIIVLAVALVVLIGVVKYAADEDDVISTGNVAAEGASAGSGSANASISDGGDGSTTGDKATSGNGANLPQTPISTFVFIDIDGAVERPGVIAMPAGSRVIDAIEAAGGLAADADVTGLNRAAILNDSDKIYIPTAAEVEAGTVPQGAGFTAAAGSTNTGVSSAGLVNINTADSDGLQTLSGVGPATAQKIIDYRTSYGAFKTPEDLMNVSGIGEKTFAKLRDKITV